MAFGLEKCAKVTFKKGKPIQAQNLMTGATREIQEPEQGKTYKFLGIEEKDGVQHQ